MRFLSVEKTLELIGLKLPVPPPPVASYVPFVMVDGFLFISGQGTYVNGSPRYIGKVGRELTLEDGKKAAEICALNCLAQMKAALGSLDRVARVVKLTVFVNSDPSFNQQPLVGNGASDLLVKVFGENGKHARSSVGAASLPQDIAVEVDMIVKIRK